MAVPLHHFAGEAGGPACAHLFVYGTLRVGFSNQYAQLLSQVARLLGKATIRARLYDLGDYPGLRIISEGTERVTGDLFELSDASLFDELDGYEGNMFRRVQSTAVLEDGRSVCAWLYEYNGPVREDQRILSGDFLRR